MSRKNQLLDILTYGFTVAMFFDADSMQVLMNKVYMFKASEMVRKSEETFIYPAEQ